MNKNKLIIRRVVQAICALVGLLGILLMIGGFAWVIVCLRERSFVRLIFVIPAFLFSGIMITVTYQALFRYSLETINHIATLSWFIVFGLACTIWPMPNEFRFEENIMAYGGIFIPLMIAWAADRAIKLLLCKFTVIEDERFGSKYFHYIADSAA